MAERESSAIFVRASRAAKSARLHTSGSSSAIVKIAADGALPILRWNSGSWK
jgi:hypothetical protein